MKNKGLVLFFCGCACFLSLFTEATALEEKVGDLSVSVEVAPVFSLALDNPNLAFGLINPGQTKTLGEGRFFNELKCRSNSGRTWYLKAQLVSLKVLGKDYSLSPSRLKYRIADLRGSAKTYARLEFKEFSEQPLLIYTSEGEDNRGKEVILGLQYLLSSPEDAPAGNYVGQIIFTMAESP